MSATRRLTAILAADVAGYSRLMGADEEGTHERLKAHLAELVNPKITEHRGRIVKNTGDGFLAEFASVLDAVRCAVGVQRGMLDREPGVPAEHGSGDACPPPIATVSPAVDRQNGDRSLQDYRSDPAPGDHSQPHDDYSAVIPVRNPTIGAYTR
jgi:hypothetical protein